MKLSTRRPRKKLLVIGAKCRNGHTLTAKTLKIVEARPSRRSEQRSCGICNAINAQQLRLKRRLLATNAPLEVLVNSMALDHWETWV